MLDSVGQCWAAFDRVGAEKQSFRGNDMAGQTKGLCKYCGKEYARGGMLRHLAACRERKEKIEPQNGKRRYGYFELVITGKYENAYWLIVEAKETETLWDLDEFIRDIWVECCGHLSAFEIDGILYESNPSPDIFWGPPAKSMDCKLKNVLSVGQTINYEYDFGSPTELVIKVHSYRQGAGEKGITILSRNNPPQILCSHCQENDAEWIQSEYRYGEKPFWCMECLRKVNMEEQEDVEDPEELEEWTDDELVEGCLPVCNSPRMGICGYDGSRVYSDQFVPDKKEK